MMLSEFEKLTGLEVTTAEYAKIEAEYMESPDDKAKFCKMWLKKGGLQRLHNARLEEIEHLKSTARTTKKHLMTILPSVALMGISLSPKRKLQSSSVLSTVSTKIGLSLFTMSKSMRRIGTE